MAVEYKYHTLGNYQFLKQPGEQFPVIGDFTDILDTNETIDVNSSSATVTDENNQDVTSTMTVANSLKIDSNGKKLQITVKGGSDGKSYKVTLRAATSDNNIYEMDFKMNVQEI